jgi:TRAP-type C4-dicarboxylate transport system substrate-binding protein
MKKINIVGLLTGLLLVAVSSIGFSQQTPVKMKLGHSDSATHHYQTTALKFAEIVSKKTNGAIEKIILINYAR